PEEGETLDDGIDPDLGVRLDPGGKAPDVEAEAIADKPGAAPRQAGFHHLGGAVTDRRTGGSQPLEQCDSAGNGGVEGAVGQVALGRELEARDRPWLLGPGQPGHGKEDGHADRGEPGVQPVGGEPRGEGRPHQITSLMLEIMWSACRRIASSSASPQYP